jgi:hypothetical protein
MIVILLSDLGSQPNKLPLRRLHSCHPRALPIRSVLLDRQLGTISSSAPDFEVLR